MRMGVLAIVSLVRPRPKVNADAQCKAVTVRCHAYIKNPPSFGGFGNLGFTLHWHSNTDVHEHNTSTSLALTYVYMKNNYVRCLTVTLGTASKIFIFYFVTCCHKFFFKPFDTLFSQQVCNNQLVTEMNPFRGVWSNPNIYLPKLLMVTQQACASPEQMY